MGCSNSSERIIILSKASKNYINWLDDGNTIILDAYTINNNDSILKIADGIVLTAERILIHSNIMIVQI